MDTAGGENWMEWKLERAAAGLPVVDVPQPKNVPPKAPLRTKTQWKKDVQEDTVLQLDPTKTGAAAVLP